MEEQEMVYEEKAEGKENRRGRRAEGREDGGGDKEEVKWENKMRRRA
jgi:hypothetical protein